MKTMKLMILGGTLSCFAATFALAAAIDPNNIPDPDVVCNALSTIALSKDSSRNSTGVWKQSKGTKGGWICSNSGTVVEIGDVGASSAIPSSINYFVFGSGPNK